MVEKSLTSQNLDLFIGSEEIRTRLNRELTNPSQWAYLLVGPDNVGKGFLAKLMAASLLDQDWRENLVHPDLVIFQDLLKKNVSTTGEKQWKQSVDELIYSIHLSSVQAERRVAVVQNIDEFSIQALNALLKTLEEPPAKSIIIMTATNKDKVLPTILSRAKTIRLNFLSDQEIQKWLSKNLLEHVEELTVVSNGCIGLAMNLIKDSELLKNVLDNIQNFQTIMDKDLFKSLQIANQKDKEQSLNLLDLWVNLIRRVWLNQIGYQDLPKSMKRFVGKHSNESLIAFLGRLQEAKAAILNNANPRMALESVVVSSLV